MPSLRYFGVLLLFFCFAWSPVKGAVDLVGFDGRTNANPQVRAAYFAVTETQSYWDNIITLRFAVANLGNTAAGAFTVKFFLSPNTTIGDASDYVIFTRSFSSLAASNVTWVTDQPVFLPSVNPFGTGTTFYVGMVVDADNQVAESNETNNKNQGAFIDRTNAAITILAPTPNIQVTDSVAPTNDKSLPFGNVANDGSGSALTTRTVSIYNNGQKALNVTGISMVGGTHFRIEQVISNIQKITQPATFPKAMAYDGAETWTITVICDPTATGAVTDTLRITSDDPDTPTLNVALSATGTAVPEIQVADTTPPLADLAEDFGSVSNDGANGASVSRTFEITNIGSGPLTVSQNGISMLTGTHFKLVSITSTTQGAINLAAAAKTLAAASAEKWNVVVKFDPAVTGKLSDGLKILSNDTDEGTLNVSCVGSALSPTALVVWDPVAPNNDKNLAMGSVHADGAGKQTAKATLQLYNTGETPLTIPVNGITLGSSTHFQLGQITSNKKGIINLAAGPQVLAGSSTEIWEVAVTFDPTAFGALSTTLGIATTPATSVTLTGTGLNVPDLFPRDTVPDTRDRTVPFGFVLNDGAGGTVATEDLVLRDIGAAPLVFAQDGISLSSPGFRIVSLTSSIPGRTVNLASSNEADRTLAAAEGEVWTVRVEFDPTVSEAHNGTVTLTSNDANEPVISMNLSGTGVTPVLTMYPSDEAGSGYDTAILEPKNQTLRWKTAYVYAGGPDGGTFEAKPKTSVPVVDLYWDTDYDSASGLIPLALGVPVSEAEQTHTLAGAPDLSGQTGYFYARMTDGARTIGSYSKKVHVWDDDVTLVSPAVTTSTDYAWEVALGGSVYKGTKALQPGENRVQIPVTLPDGSSAYYEFLVTRHDSLLDSDSRTYDEEQRLKTYTNGNGIVTTLIRDAAGRVIRRESSNGAVVSFVYDAASRRTSMTDSTGTTFYEWDDLNRLTAKITSDNAVKGDADDLPLRYEYDLASRLTAIVYPGGERIEHTYDAAGRMLTVNNVTRNLLFTYEYTPSNGLLKALNRPNGVRTEYFYDGMGRLNRITHKNGATLILDLEYTLNAAGNATLLTTREPGVTKLEKYTYDNAGRLTEVIYSEDGTIDGNDRKEAFSYDGNGNRLTYTLTENGVVTKLHHYQYGNENRLMRIVDGAGVEVSRYVYDAAGNRVQKITAEGTTFYEYDDELRLVEIESRELNLDLVLDGDGVCVAEVLNGVATQRVISEHSGFPEVVWELDETSMERVKILGEGLLAEIETGFSFQLPLADRLGSIRSKVDMTSPETSIFSYSAFGGAPAALKEGFAGQEHLPGGLVYLRARVYDPETGAFISKDPLGVAAGTNSYQYCGNDPVNKIDLLGLDWTDDLQNGAAGYADSVTFGFTKWAREQGGSDFIDYNSAAYQNTHLTTTGVTLAIGLGEIKAGVFGLKSLFAAKTSVNASNAVVIGESMERVHSVASAIGVSEKALFSGKTMAQNQLWVDDAIAANKQFVTTGTDPYRLFTRGELSGSSTYFAMETRTANAAGVSLTYAPPLKESLVRIGTGMGASAAYSSSLFSPGGVLIDKAAQLIGSNLSDLKGASYDPSSGQLVFLGTENPTATKDLNMDYFFTAVQAVYGSATPPFVTLDPPAVDQTDWLDLGDGDGVFEPGEAGGFTLRYYPLWADEDTYVDVKIRATWNSTPYNFSVRLNAHRMDGPITIIAGGRYGMRLEFGSATGLPTGVLFDESWFSPSVLVSSLYLNSTSQDSYWPVVFYNTGSQNFIIEDVTVQPARQHRKYGGRVEGTRLGWVMYEADRVMKCLSVGKDNLTGALYNSSTVPITGYKNMIERIQAGGQGGNIRMWFVPNEMTLKRHLDPSTGRATVVFDRSSVSLLTESYLQGVAATPIAQDFANHFTTNYDAFAARTFPVQDPNDPTGATVINVKIFEMLKEAMQAVSLARFFRDNNVPLDLWWLNQWEPPTAHSPKSIASAFNEVTPGGNSISVFGGVQVQKPNAYVPSSAAESVGASVVAARPNDAVKPTEELKQQTWTANTTEGNLRAVAASLEPEQQDANVTRADVFLSFPSPGALPLSFGAFYQSSWLGKEHLGPGWRCQRYMLEFGQPSLYDEQKQLGLPTTSTGDTRLRSGEVRLVDLASGVALDFYSSMQRAYSVNNFGYAQNALTGLNASLLPTFAPGLRKNGTTLVQQANFSYTATTPGGDILTFDSNGRLLTTTDKNGHTQTWAYDSTTGRLSTISDEAGQSITLTYATDGKLASATGPAGVGVTIQYDPSGRMQHVVRVPGNIIVQTYSYNAQNQLADVTNLSGVKTLRTTADDKGRADVAKDARDNSFDNSFFKDAAAQTKTVKSKDVASALAASEQTTDMDGRVTRTKNIYGNETKYGYANGSLQPTSIQLPTPGRPAVQITRNGLDLPTSIHDPAVTGAAPVQITYNAANLPTKLDDTLQRDTDLEYTPENNLKKITQYLGGQPVSANVTWENGYPKVMSDPMGHATTVNRNALGQVTSVVDPTGVTVSYEYDGRNRLWKIHDPRLSSPIIFTYDDLDRVLTMTTPAGTTTYTYDPTKKWLTKVTDVLGREVSFTYDNTTGDISKTSLKLTESETLDTTYERNRLGDVSSIVPPGGQAINFNVDDGGMLMSTSETNAANLGKPKNLTSSGAVSGQQTIERNHTFTWGAPDSDIPVVGYSWAFDAAPDDNQDGASPLATWNNVATGNHTFQVKARNSSGQWGDVAIFNLNVVNMGFEFWRQQKFAPQEVSDPSLSAEASDPDHDRVSNLMEYALGLEPKHHTWKRLSGSVPGLPELDLGSDSLSLTYHRDLSKTDINYIPQWSTDLITWNSTGFTETVMSTEGTVQTVRATIPRTQTRILLKLQVSQVPAPSPPPVPPTPNP